MSKHDANEYGQLLRAMGQALEILKFGTFEMEVAEQDFVVRGSAVTSSQQEEAQAIRERVRKFVWDALPGVATSPEEIDFAMSTWPAKLDLRYTPKDLDRLQQEGKAKRQTGIAVPDVARLSQLLRTIGAYVEHKQARLVKISRYGGSLAICYETGEGKTREESVSAGSLYEFWVRLYLQRSRRGGS
jgi:hypothetical protein